MRITDRIITVLTARAHPIIRWDIRHVIAHGEIIEDYPDDEPCPSALFLGFTAERPCHVVVSQCEDHARVITVYVPEKDKWIDYRIRKE